MKKNNAQTVTLETLFKQFEQHEAAYIADQQARRQSMHLWHRISLGTLIAIPICFLLGSLSPYFILAGILLTLGILFPIAKASPASENPEKAENRSRARLLRHFFSVLAQDLAPDGKVKMHWNPQPENGYIRPQDIYKKQRSPHSGAQKVYAKKYWARFKLELIDGSLLDIKCWDKVKTKGSIVVRFERYAKSGILPNTLIYKSTQPPLHQQRTLLGKRELSFYQSPEAYAEYLLRELKQNWRQNMIPRHELVKQTASVAAAPPTLEESASTVSAQCTQILTHLKQSPLPIQQIELAPQRITLHYQPENYPAPDQLKLEWSSPNAPSPLLRIKLHGPSSSDRALLLANPSLGDARFARVEQTLYLVSPVLELDDLDDKIAWLSACADRLSKTPLPERIHSSPAKGSAAQQEQNVAVKKALQNAFKNLKLLAPPEYMDDKCKIHLELSKGRKQTLHLRFDRQNIRKQPTLYIFSYCAPDDPQHYAKALQDNYSPHASGLGLVAWGGSMYLSVYDSLPYTKVCEADLAQKLLALAERADQVEQHFTSGDRL